MIMNQLSAFRLQLSDQYRSLFEKKQEKFEDYRPALPGGRLTTGDYFQKGQVLIVLLLTTLVVLTAGLAITVRSLNDVTTSTRNDQSQRAFSAAEAGIEKYLANPATVTGIQSPIPAFDNDSSVEVRANVDVPPLPTVSIPTQPALEYPPIGKDTIAQFWIVDPRSVSTTPVQVFNGTGFTLFFGNPGQTLNGNLDAPAVEINMVTFNSSTNQYSTVKTYLDSHSSSRGTTTGFRLAGEGGLSCSTSATANGVPTTSSVNSANRYFACSYTISSNCGSNCFPIIIRVRLLYSSTNQRIALRANPGNTSTTSLPRQAEIYYAKGTSGQSQQILKSFKIPKVIPTFLDFAVFSIGAISK